jgi:hypothetical protein
LADEAEWNKAMILRTLVLVGVVLVALARLIPHPPNFTLIGALPGPATGGSVAH